MGSYDPTSQIFFLFFLFFSAPSALSAFSAFSFSLPLRPNPKIPLQSFRVHAPHHPIPPSPRNLPLPPRSPQNLPLPPPKTPSRLRQHPHHSCRINLPLERKNRNRPRTSPPDQDHHPPPKIPRKGSPTPPLLRHPRIPSPPHLRRLPRLPPLALRLLQTVVADLQVGHSCFSLSIVLRCHPDRSGRLFLARRPRRAGHGAEGPWQLLNPIQNRFVSPVREANDSEQSRARLDYTNVPKCCRLILREKC